jgi:hypothetical protein
MCTPPPRAHRVRQSPRQPLPQFPAHQHPGSSPRTQPPEPGIWRTSVSAFSRGTTAGASARRRPRHGDGIGVVFVEEPGGRARGLKRTACSNAAMRYVERPDVLPARDAIRSAPPTDVVISYGVAGACHADAHPHPPGGDRRALRTSVGGPGRGQALRKPGTVPTRRRRWPGCSACQGATPPSAEHRCGSTALTRLEPEMAHGDGAATGAEDLCEAE